MTRVLNWTEQVFAGTAPVEADRMFASLQQYPQSRLVTLEDFSHYAALVCEEKCCAIAPWPKRKINIGRGALCPETLLFSRADGFILIWISG